MITFILVNYNLSKELAQCLEGIECHVRISHEVIIVDNGSSDSDWDGLKKTLESRERTTVICLGENVGFGAACNRGAKIASGEILCFINPDIVITEEFTDKVLENFQSMPRAVVVGVRSSVKRWFDFSAGPLPNLLLETMNIVLVGRYLEALWVYFRSCYARAPMQVGWVVGACLFIKRASFYELDGFDEDYFLYYEEVDLCHRVRNNGGTVLYDTRNQVSHIGSVAGARDYAAFTERFYTSKKKYIAKQYAGMKRSVLEIVVHMQMISQIGLWSILRLFGASRSSAKLEGLHVAMRYKPTTS
ncbi:MAG: glycosyl transferase [marine bacterium B5-7]|nr:MAG: glycosyl transferase [marine bacterium B5-7]